MKKWIVIGIVAIVVLVAGAAVVALGGTWIGNTAETPGAAAALPAVQSNGDVVAEARVVPVRWAALAFPTGGRVATVTVQEGDTVTAGQELARLDDAVLRYAVERARASLASAEAHLTQLKDGAQPADIAAAQANLDAAKAELARVRRGATPEEVAVAEARVQQAQVGVNRAQSEYDQVKVWGEKPAAPAFHALNAAYANLAVAKAELARVKAPATSETIAAAQARVGAAQATVDKIQAGATAAEIAAAQAQVAEAKAALGQVEATLGDAILKAPFAGTITSIQMRAGEMASPGMPVVWLGDLSAWQIETTDLTELDVARVREGAPVTISFDALPDLKLPGKVTRVEALGTNKQGDIVYTVVVTPDQHDERLRWNMTAVVAIEP
ncbi:MAG: HlyD family secretion protein [Chloroflexi bacterium]|nr:HlyD family secretion protein [Chloroflexota bacterium]